MADEPSHELDGLPPEARAQYDALSPENRAYYRPVYAKYATDLRANREYLTRIDQMLADPQPNFPAIRKLLGVPPDADVDVLRAELKRQYGLP
jgi:hypothetical protein